MILPDVNVLVYAHRSDVPDHEAYRTWLEKAVASESAFGIAEVVLSGFVRVVTHAAIFPTPTPLREALAQADALRARPNCVLVAPGARHWELFVRLCSAVRARGNLVADAYLAALAIESGSEWITTDRDFSRFPELRWRHPLS